MRRRILTVLIIATIAFIWIHSMIQTEISAQESGWVMELIRPFLELFAGKGMVTQHMVRKLAHFSEFFLLGAELTLYGMFFSKGGRVKDERRAAAVFLKSALFGLAAAAVDEIIQIFAKRGPQVKDVLLDFTGVLAGTLLIILICGIAGRIRNRHEKEERWQERQTRS